MADATATHACSRKPESGSPWKVEREDQQWWLRLYGTETLSTPIVCCPWCGLMLMRPTLNMRSLHDAVEVG